MPGFTSPFNSDLGRELDQRFVRGVAVLDVLGYKTWMRRDLEEVWNTFDSLRMNLAAELLRGTAPVRGPGFILHPSPSSKKTRMIHYADSFLLYCTEQSDEALKDLVRRTKDALAVAFAHGVPMRAAVTYGEAGISETDVEYTSPDLACFYTGEALVRAHQLADCQAWAGGIVDPERLNCAKIHEDLGPENVTVATDAPFKEGENTHEVPSLCLNWPGAVILPESSPLDLNHAYAARAWDFYQRYRRA